MTSRLFTACVCTLFATCLGPATANAEELPPLRDVEVQSSLDGQPQPCRVWAPEGAATTKTPLLIFLHSWSGDYRQDNRKWLEQAVDRDWIYLHPNFRGRNDDPQACGSPLARQDVLDALDWAFEHYQVDPARVYLAGTSGGGHMAMLMAARHGERFSAVSAWVGISDLAQWYRFHSRPNKLGNAEPGNYAKMVAACCGGAPGESAAIDQQYRDRSSIYWLQDAGDLPLDLNAGVTDGKTGSVPFTHTLRAFNEVAAAGGYATVSKAEMDQLWQHGRLEKPQPQDTAEDASFGRAIHLRRHAGPARVTIFEGGHEGLPIPACDWLERQRREVPVPATSEEVPSAAAR
ncbi:alpha/beta hydrolase family protein [Candidatus Laterigemmans baculatus]|uniref:alpha/beta hydrolase family protein n=1 Tax=Candidatus Laterigemmans baculatus TaxID=2770505 RepID=UPI0013DC07A3|nr:prolyl oligopeptidase family serine peptidase [Candidatus Laterigemmans baculatus]